MRICRNRPRCHQTLRSNHVMSEQQRSANSAGDLPRDHVCLTLYIYSSASGDLNRVLNRFGAMRPLCCEVLHCPTLAVICGCASTVAALAHRTHNSKQDSGRGGLFFWGFNRCWLDSEEFDRSRPGRHSHLHSWGQAGVFPAAPQRSR